MFFRKRKNDGFCVILLLARIKADTLTGIRRKTEETGLRNSDGVAVEFAMPGIIRNAEALLTSFVLRQNVARKLFALRKARGLRDPFLA
jgi:hypothetical protein